MPKFKNGQFVKLANPPRVGIMFAAGEESSTVHIVDETGLTIDSVIVPNDQIERAREQDLPESRRTFQESVKQLKAAAPEKK